MPCQSEYMNANAREIESTEVANYLIYVSNSLQKNINHSWILASNNYYGTPDKLDEFTRTLCDMLGSLTRQQESTIVYDGRNPQARKLADWWERHQQADRDRIAREKQDVLDRARAKLTVDEMDALKRSILGY